MAKQKDILERRNSLKKFIYDKGNGKLKFEVIKKFYSENYSNESFSDSTIRSDLNAIDVKCNKRINTYYFRNHEDIIKSKELLMSLLKDCTMYKPFKFAIPLDTSSFIDADNNPHTKLFYILIKSNSKYDLTFIQRLISELRKLYSLKEENLDLCFMDICVSNHYVKFLFDDFKELKVFYKELYELKYGEGSSQKSESKES